MFKKKNNNTKWELRKLRSELNSAFDIIFDLKSVKADEKTLREGFDLVAEGFELMKKKIDALEEHLGVESRYEEAHEVPGRFVVSKKKKGKK